MRNLLLIILFSGFCCFLKGQTKFEKGYFINTDGSRVECLIKNESWRYNPSEFLYVIKDSDEPVTVKAGQVKEFGLYEGNRFVSMEVMVDVSSEDMENLTKEKEPSWLKMTLYLSVLAEGDAVLYKYHSPSMLRFFYSKTDQPLQQLVYKNYKPEGERDFIGTNLYYKVQLWNSLNFNGLNTDRLNKLNYDDHSLTRFFTDYNLSKGENKLYHKKYDGGAFHIYITPGMAFSTVNIEGEVGGLIVEDGPKYNLGTESGFRIGACLELVFPYTNKKVAFLVEPTYRSYNESILVWTDSITANLNLIEVPIGFRYYAFLKNNFRLFGNVLICPGAFTGTLNSTVGRESTVHKETVSPRGGFTFGGGVSWKRLSMEFRYNLPKKFTSPSFLTRLNSFEIIAGFKIL